MQVVAVVKIWLQFGMYVYSSGTMGLVLSLKPRYLSGFKTVYVKVNFLHEMFFIKLKWFLKPLACLYYLAL